MKKILLALLLLAASSRAVDTLSVPTDFNSVSSGTRANLTSNFTAIQTWGNKIRDTLAPVTSKISGFSGTLLVRSLSSLRLKLDYDNTETARLLVESGNGDSLFTVREDTTAKFYGPLTLNKTLAVTQAATFSDSILGVSQRLTGNINSLGAKAILNTNTTDSTIAKGVLRVNGRLQANDSILGASSARLTGNLIVAKVTASDSLIGTAVKGTKGIYSDTVVGANLKTAGSLSVTGNGTIAKLTASDSLIGTIHKGTGATFSGDVRASGTGGASYGLCVPVGVQNTTNSVNNAEEYGFKEDHGNFVASIAGINTTTSASSATAAGALAFLTKTTAVGTYPAERMRIHSTGNVSIGSATDNGFPLEVTGTAKVTGNFTADSLISSKAFVPLDSFTVTLRGCSNPDPTGTAFYSRNFKTVTLYLPGITCTSDSAGMALTGLPAALGVSYGGATPLISIPVVMDNSNTYVGWATIGAASLGFSFKTSLTGAYTTPFTASGTKGFSQATTITYIIH